MPARADKAVSDEVWSVLLRYAEFSGQKLSANHVAAATGFSLSRTFARIAKARSDDRTDSAGADVKITGGDVFKKLVEYAEASGTKLNAAAVAKATGLSGSRAFAKIAAARKEIEGTETGGSSAKPKATPIKKAQATKKSPRKKRSASEAMDDEDGADAGDAVSADNSPTKKARKAVKKVKEEIKEEEEVEDEAVLTIAIKADEQADERTTSRNDVDEAGLSITIKAEKRAEEGTTATNNDGQPTGDNAVSEMGTQSEQVKDGRPATPETSAEILSHLAAHHVPQSSTGSSLPPLTVDSTAVNEEQESSQSLAPFGYGKVDGKTQARRGRSATVNSVRDPREADLAVDQFVEQLDAESGETTKWEHRQDEKVFVA